MHLNSGSVCYKWGKINIGTLCLLFSQFQAFPQKKLTCFCDARRSQFRLGGKKADGCGIFKTRAYIFNWVLHENEYEFHLFCNYDNRRGVWQNTEYQYGCYLYNSNTGWNNMLQSPLLGNVFVKMMRTKTTRFINIWKLPFLVQNINCSNNDDMKQIPLLSSFLIFQFSSCRKILICSILAQNNNDDEMKQIPVFLGWTPFKKKKYWLFKITVVAKKMRWNKFLYCPMF